MAPSKSSQKAKNAVIVLLALWSIVSLIVIVVWATSPDLKSSAQCRAELRDKTEKLEGVKVVCNKDKVALEEQVEAGRAEQARQEAQILLLLGRHNITNATLEECRQENVVLNGNVSVLQENIEQLRQTEANLTAQISLQEDHIETLEQNLTQAALKTESCFSMRAAAENQKLAAESETRACESNQKYLNKQLQKCKSENSEGRKQKAAPPAATPAVPCSAPTPLSGIPALMLLVCSALHVMTCE